MEHTSVKFVEYIKEMKERGARYWYGCYGNNCTLSKYEQKKRQYPSHYTANRTTQYKKDIANNQVCVDCIGLLKSYMWSTDDGASVLAAIGTGTPTNVKYASNGFPDKSADGMFAYAKAKGMEYGTISSIPELPGVAVRYTGHVGYYIGNGRVIEARGFNYGTVETALKDRKWTDWYKIPGLTYDKAVEPTPTTKLGDRTLKRGMKGDDVAELQNILVHTLGYDLGTYGTKKDGVDGDFGAKCEAAVKDFQAKKGLTADGIYGKKTHAALMSAIADAEPDEEPETPVGDKILVVSGDSVRIRKGNSTAYSIITTVKKGTVLIPVLDKKDNPLVSADGWNAVVLDGQVGWISNKYVREGR